VFGTNGQISGFFNTGAPGTTGNLFAGQISGLLNMGTQVPGIFNIVSLLKNLT
jgi:hypothetical protein